MVQFGPTFPGSSLYVEGSVTPLGEVTLHELALTVVVCLKTAAATGPPPFARSLFAQNPLTPPYLTGDGYYIFDLSYYSELTYMDKPPRVCFHDSAQELALALNFSDKESLDKFGNSLREFLTVTAPGLPGFFKLFRFTPIVSQSPDFEGRKKKAKEAFLKAGGQNLEFLSGITRIVSLISPQEGQLPLEPDEAALADAFVSREALEKYLQKHLVSKWRKAQVWAYLIGIPDLNAIDDYFVERYELTKRQWATICFSQIRRSAIMTSTFKLLASTVLKFKQKLVTVVHDIFILKIVFDVAMTANQLYPFVSSNFDVVIHLIRVLLSIFVGRIHRDENGQPWIVVNDAICLDVLRFEAVLFWSVIHIMERGEIRRLLTGDKAGVSELITDFLFAVLPGCFAALHTPNNNSPFDAVTLHVMTYLGSCLPMCDCTNLWLLAFSRRCPFNFLTSVFLSAFLLPIAQQKKRPSVSLIEESFQVQDTTYLMAAGGLLNERLSSLFVEALARQSS
jgi:hypothetical protein